MKHYVCEGDCGGESARPGVCEAEGCSHESQPLVECDCEDGLHNKSGEEIVDEVLPDDE